VILLLPPEVLTRVTVRKAAIFAFVGLVLASFPHRVFAKDEFQYDATTCKTDPKGHLFIALGPNVLSIPFSKRGVYLLDSVMPKARRRPPDPSEPEGCPGNPSQQKSFALFAGTPLADIEQGATSAHREAPTKLTLFDTWDPDRSADPAQFRWFGELNPGFPELTCSHSTIRETLPNGLTACRVPLSGQPNAAVEDLAAAYFSDPAVYAIPLGRRFIIHCTPYLYSGPTFGGCEVAYSITADLAVAYEFQPYLGRSPIPIEHIIEFDRKLRAQIDAATVKDFIWPSQDGDKSGLAGGKP
jgi:hypothetical protein